MEENGVVQLATLLAEEHVLEIIERPDPRNDRVLKIRLNNEEYLVVDLEDKGAENPEKSNVVDLKTHYNMAFLESINDSELPLITQAQNKELLLSAAYKLLRYLPLTCKEDPEDIKLSEVQSEIKNMCASWLDQNATLAGRLDPEENVDCYEEVFDCRAKYDNGREQAFPLAFRFQRSTHRDFKDPEAEGEIVSEAIAVDIREASKDDKVIESNARFKKWLTAHASKEGIGPLLELREKNRVRRHMLEMLDLKLNKQSFFENSEGIFGVLRVKAEASKYYRIQKYPARFDVRIKPDTCNLLSIKKNFDNTDGTAYFVYEPALISTENILKCPTPSCGRYKYGKRDMELFVDPNWRKEYRAIGQTREDKAGYRYAVGCRACMSEECAFCGQRFYPYAKIEELSAFYGYSVLPKKEFLHKWDDTSDAGVLGRLKSGEDRMSDYCACQEGVYWFYDEAFKEDSGKENARVLRNRDMVFINHKTKEVVAAYSPLSYEVSKKSFLSTYQKSGEEGARAAENETASACVSVFFSDYLEKNVKKAPTLQALKEKKKALAETWQTSFNDPFDIFLVEAYCASKSLDKESFIRTLKEEQKKQLQDERASTPNLNALREYGVKSLSLADIIAPSVLARFTEGFSEEKKVALIDALKKELADLLKSFTEKLSRAVSLDGKNRDLIRITSVQSCSICKICGGLYFDIKEKNEAVTLLPNTHETDDICAVGKEENRGRWSTMRGAIIYKDKKGLSGLKRYVLTRKGEKAFKKWQEDIKNEII